MAPYIHEDTKLIFSVASIITMIKSNMLSLSSDAQTTDEFIGDMKENAYFGMIDSRTKGFVSDIRTKLNQLYDETKGERSPMRYEIISNEDDLSSMAAESSPMERK